MCLRLSDIAVGSTWDPSENSSIATCLPAQSATFHGFEDRGGDEACVE